jgi:hypothetical protein
MGSFDRVPSRIFRMESQLACNFDLTVRIPAMGSSRHLGTQSAYSGTELPIQKPQQGTRMARDIRNDRKNARYPRLVGLRKWTAEAIVRTL